MSDPNNLIITPKQNKYRTLFKRVAITSIAVSTLVFGTVSADSKIQKVYHVYIDGERIGTVDNRNLVEDVIDSKIDAIKEKYDGLTLSAAGVSIIEEQTFRPSVSNSSTVKTLESELGIVAKATAITVDGEPIAYLKSKEEAEAAIKQLKLNYVKPEDLQALEAKAKIDTPPAPLAVGQSRILDVAIAENVSLEDSQISPDKVTSPEDTVTLFLKGTLEEKKYKVKEGDVLGSIAEAHDLRQAELLKLNPGVTEETVLQIDQELNVTAYKPLLTVVVKMEQSKKETIAYETQVVDNANMFKGDRKVTQEGQNGEKVVHYETELKNGQTSSTKKIEEKITKEPVTYIVQRGTKVVPSRGTGQLSWPTNGGYISSHVGYRWGRLHKGIDIARPSNYTIKAADNGTVVEAGYDGSFGNKIVINHNNGMRTLYAHLSSINVRVGQTVSQGQQIGVMGSTGHSTGTHLHFELYINGNLVNPLDHL
ncbi:peptidoglycan DD-metalloendopeptidase family protein [Fredinandcohnia humi]